MVASAQADAAKVAADAQAHQARVEAEHAKQVAALTGQAAEYKAKTESEALATIGQIKGLHADEIRQLRNTWDSEKAHLGAAVSQANNESMRLQQEVTRLQNKKCEVCAQSELAKELSDRENNRLSTQITTIQLGMSARTAEAEKQRDQFLRCRM